MEPGPYQPQLQHFSTHGVPASKRLRSWQESFACRVADIQPLADEPFEAEATLLALPGFVAGWCRSASPVAWHRTADLVKDGDDSFAFLMPVRGALTRSQRGHDIDVGAGEGVGILNGEPASVRLRHLKHIVLMVPRSCLSPLVANLEDASTRHVPRSTEALRLLGSYLASLRRSPAIADPSLRGLVATHVNDLLALAIGASREGDAVARRRGLPAARLRAIKCDIDTNPGLDLASLAARHHVTPRYVQMLFERDGTTFSAYVLEQRLDRAYRMLTDPHHARRLISAIALDVGFGDISYFNSSFKRRFSGTPSEVRASALNSR